MRGKHRPEGLEQSHAAHALAHRHALLSRHLLGANLDGHGRQVLDKGTLHVASLALVQALAIAANHVAAAARLEEHTATLVGKVGARHGRCLALAAGANLARVLALGSLGRAGGGWLLHLTGHLLALDQAGVHPAGTGPAQADAVGLGQLVTGRVVQSS